MAKITIELDQQDAERVLENHDRIVELLESILKEVKKNGKVPTNNRSRDVSHET
jgi:hypothetical protein